MTDFYSSSEQRAHILFRAGRTVWYALVFVEAALTVRLVTQIIAPNLGSTILHLTQFLVYPVRYVIPGSLGIEVTTFIAMVLYWLAGFVAIKLIVELRPAPETQLEAAIERED